LGCDRTSVLKGHDFTDCGKLNRRGKEFQGTTSQSSEKLNGRGKKCQGTTSVVPIPSKKECGL
jgi:hypothetical protein